MAYTEQNYLKHYGVKGMRKGQRKTPRDMAQISGPGRAEYGANARETELGYTMYRNSAVAGQRKQQYRARARVTNNASQTDVNRAMAGRGGWRGKDTDPRRRRSAR